MIPCREVGAASMRQPSTTTSWVADPKATRKVKSAVAAMAEPGSEKATPTSPIATTSWLVIIQARRRPTRRDRTGTSKASTRGDHRNLKL